MKKILLVLFILTTVPRLFSEDYADLFTILEEDETPEGADLSAFVLSLEGEHMGGYGVPLSSKHWNYEGPVKGGFSKSDFTLKGESDAVKVLLSLQHDLNKTDTPTIGESYLSYSMNKANLTVGNKIYSWGTADTINPTDNLNPLNYRNSVEPDKESLFALELNLFPADFIHNQILFIPYKGESTWSTDPVILLGESLNQELGFTPSITKNRIEEEPQSYVFGIRNAFFLKNLDFSLSYIYDYDQFFTPEFSLILTDISDSLGLPPGSVTSYVPQTVQLERRRIHKMGLDLRSNIGILGLWGELCLSLSSIDDLNGYKRRNPDISWVVGTDFHYGPEDRFYLNMQYLGTYQLEHDHSFYDDYPGGEPDSSSLNEKTYMEEFYYRESVNQLANISEEILHGLSLKMEWPLVNNTIIPSFEGIITQPVNYSKPEDNTRLFSLRVLPSIELIPASSLSLRLRSEYNYSFIKNNGNLRNDQGDTLGGYFKDSAVILEITYKWLRDL